MAQKGFADMHVHTNRSDGRDTPERVVERAAGMGFACISITDHDTCAGYHQAIGRADELGLELIPGIEVSTCSGEKSVHLLGYMVNTQSDAIKTLVTKVKASRLERMDRMIHRINALGYALDIEEMLEFTGQGTLGRANLARLLVKKGYFSSISAVFDSILGDGKPVYEPVGQFSPEEAIGLIAEAGGVSSLAHPGINDLENDLERYVSAGLDGVEVFTPRHSPETGGRYARLAADMGLLLTGGSDCHGESSQLNNLGSVKVPMELVERIREKAVAAIAGAAEEGKP